MLFSANYTALCLIRTALDRTAKQGVLPIQDDLAIAGDVAELPYDKLARRLGELGVELHDHRQTPRSKGSRGEAHGTRKLEKVTAICWHQMACVIEDVMRCLGIPAHIAILPNAVVLLHPLRAYCYHGHAANSFSVGIEVACRSAGIEGDARTFWRSSKEKAAGKEFARLVHEPTDLQLQVMEIVGDYVTEEIERQAKVERAAGKKVPGIVAEMFHRNSHRSRTSDMGSRGAKRVKALADRHGHEFGVPVVGSGSKTPQVWGGAAGVRYSGSVRGF